MIFARKINKIPAFYTTFARKCPNFTLRLSEKYFSGIFLWGAAPCPRHSPTFMAGPQAPHQLNQALALTAVAKTMLHNT